MEFGAIDDGSLDRHCWELCVLAELRTSLQSGAIWVSPSRKYADPATYLLPPERWVRLRGETIAMAGVDSDVACQLADMDAQLDQQTRALDHVLATNVDSGIRLDDDGHLVVPPLDAETETGDDGNEGHPEITSRVPKVDLAEVLADMDQKVGITDLFTHAGGQRTRIPDFRVHLFAAILAHGCNLGVDRMARISGLSPEQLSWVSTWYLRHETLTDANDAIVNFCVLAARPHAKQPHRSWRTRRLTDRSCWPAFPPHPRNRCNGAGSSIRWPDTAASITTPPLGPTISGQHWSPGVGDG